MDTILVLAWLVLAHLVADFVLQNDWIAINKATGGRNGWLALGTHGFHVALCLVPAVFAFGAPGLLYLVVVAGSHMAVDRWKVRATRRAEASALDAARKRMAIAGRAPGSGLGSAWTPWPGMLFLADQALHLTIAIVGWLVILAGVSLLPGFVDVVNRILRDWDRTTVNAVILTSVVLVSLFLVNTRGAYYFLMALVSPRDLPAPAPVVEERPSGAPGAARADGAPSAQGASTDVAAATPAAAGPAAAVPAAAVPAAAVPAAAVPAAAVPAAAVPAWTSSAPAGAPGRIAATVFALERVLVVAFVLSGADLLVGALVAFDALVRWRRFDDRGFVDWYLLSATGSLLVAYGSALVARAALASLGG